MATVHFNVAVPISPIPSPTTSKKRISPRSILEKKSKSCSEMLQITREDVDGVKTQMDSFFTGKSINNIEADVGQEELLLLLQIYSEQWLEENEERPTEQETLHTLETMMSTFQMTGSRLSKKVFVPVLVYTDRYVKKRGQIKKSYLMPLLFVACIVTVKFWCDCGVSDLISIRNFVEISSDTRLRKTRLDKFWENSGKLPEDFFDVWSDDWRVDGLRV